MNILKRIHLPALGGLVTAGVGLLKITADPAVLALLPHDWGVALAAIGTAVLAVTKAIHSKGQPNN